MATLKLNGEERTLDGRDGMSLMWAIRDLAGLTGTKFGSGVGLCGAASTPSRGAGGIRPLATTP